MPPGSLALLAQGAAVSLLLAAVAIVGGTLLAVLLVTIAFSRFAAVRAVYRVYVYVIRGTPLLVLALLLFYAMPALDLRTGPYIAQWESARSLGLPPLAMFRKIVAPLVTRYTLPPYVNVCVMTVKASSVLSIISVWELTLAAREIIERTFAVFTILGVAAAFYFVMCFGIDRLGRLLERHLALKGFAGERA